jgi:hypothetical protein
MFPCTTGRAPSTAALPSAASTAQTHHLRATATATATLGVAAGVVLPRPTRHMQTQTGRPSLLVSLGEFPRAESVAFDQVGQHDAVSRVAQQ